VTLAECLGFAVPAVAGAVTTDQPALVAAALLVPAGAVEGALLGWAQARVLARVLTTLSAGRLVAATSSAAAFAYLVAMIPVVLGDRLLRVPVPLLVLLGAVLGTLLLTSIGVAQWAVLRSSVPGPGPAAVHGDHVQGRRRPSISARARDARPAFRATGAHAARRLRGEPRDEQRDLLRSGKPVLPQPVPPHAAADSGGDERPAPATVHEGRRGSVATPWSRRTTVPPGRPGPSRTAASTGTRIASSSSTAAARWRAWSRRSTSTGDAARRGPATRRMTQRA
jgi:hypothetical protein